MEVKPILLEHAKPPRRPKGPQLSRYRFRAAPRSSLSHPHPASWGGLKDVLNRRGPFDRLPQVVVLEHHLTAEYRAPLSVLLRVPDHTAGRRIQGPLPTTRSTRPSSTGSSKGRQSVERVIQSMRATSLLDLSDGFVYDCLHDQAKRLDMAEHRRGVLDHFSGHASVDELHLGRYALLLATRPPERLARRLRPGRRQRQRSHAAVPRRTSRPGDWNPRWW